MRVFVNREKKSWKASRILTLPLGAWQLGNCMGLGNGETEESELLGGERDYCGV